MPRTKHKNNGKTNIIQSGSKTNKPKLKWKTIEDYPDYKVSDNGDVMRIKTGRVLKPIFRAGYHVVNLYKNKILDKKIGIHILVAKEFLPNPNNLPIVDHINNNKFDNRLINLRWINYSGNTQSWYDNHKQKRAILQYDKRSKLIKKWNCMSDILKNNKNYKRKTISASLCINRTAYGYIWKYKEENKKKINLADNEIFKSLGIFEGKDLSKYDISTHGNIYSHIKKRFLYPFKDADGYLNINLIDSKNGKQRQYKINRLVAHVFIANDNPEIKTKVNHIDENKSNDYYKNLEWITSRGNTLHSIGKIVKMIDKNTNEILNIFYCAGDALRFLGINAQTVNIWLACKDSYRTAYGYKWQYVNKNEKLEMPIYEFDDDICVITNKEITEIDNFDIY